MSVLTTDIVFYSSASMPTGDSDASGGAINSGIRVVFDDIVATDVIEASGNISDSGNLTIFGRSAVGSIVSEVLPLSGTIIVTGSTSFERILTVTSDAIASGDIVLRDSSTNVTIGTIPIRESGFLRPFYSATAEASGGSDKELYEKVFLMNLNTSGALLTTTVTEISSGVFSKVAFALEDTVQSTQSITNRLAVPTGTGPFGSGASGIVGDDLDPLEFLGIWLQLDLNAGDAAQNSFYQLQVNGSTT